MTIASWSEVGHLDRHPRLAFFHFLEAVLCILGINITILQEHTCREGPGSWVDKKTTSTLNFFDFDLLFIFSRPVVSQQCTLDLSCLGLASRITKLHCEGEIHNFDLLELVCVFTHRQSLHDRVNSNKVIRV